MIRPNDIKTTTDYHLFKDGIKPTWEDPQNKNGGKWMVRLKKGFLILMLTILTTILNLICALDFFAFRIGITSMGRDYSICDR